ncbi:MAG: hypothetical protein KKD36_12600 [Bacteroidetes bacterium]|nr:hypothetical protein [Bacteroidota bacterium]|tara:strand:+ start:11020 stop:11280 length:261 start_codon:yes stop_codon:yes gene_type:complete
MKKSIYTFILSTFTMAIYACPMCEKQQPKILRGIAHGAGPESNLDYVIVWTMVAFVIITLFFSLKYLIKPKENEKNHIKRNHLIFE